MDPIAKTIADELYKKEVAEFPGQLSPELAARMYTEIYSRVVKELTMIDARNTERKDQPSDNATRYNFK